MTATFTHVETYEIEHCCTCGIPFAVTSDFQKILDVSVPTIDFDDKTEERINQVNAERAKTTAAAQEVLTNEQKRLAAEKLAGMAPPDLRIAIANCVNKMAESGQSLNCYPIGGNALPTIAVPNPGQ